MNAAETKVLRFLAEQDRDYGVCPFSSITFATRLNRATVRRACRSLCRKGLTQFYRGCSDDDGRFTGSGYCSTDHGRDEAQKLPARKARR